MIRRLSTAILQALLAALALEAHAQAPASGTADPAVEFDNPPESESIPFELVGNHVYLQARVNGSAPLWFLLDTGATGTYLDSDQAQALGIEATDGSTGPVTLRLPGATLRLPHLRVMPMSFHGYDGHDVDGLLGYDFFQHFVVTIDYAARTLSLHAPGDRMPQQGRAPSDGIPEGDRFLLTLLEDDSGGKVPLVAARIAQAGRPPVTGQFILDTGARGCVFNTHFVNTHRMLEAVPRTITMIAGGGAMIRDLELPIGRVDTLVIGSVPLLHPLVGFARDTTGILAATEFDGVLGGDVLRRFRVILDYSAQMVRLEPQAGFTEPFEYDMSGLFLIEDPASEGHLRIRDVLEESPASEAGLAVGDAILSVDGRPAAGLTLDQLREELRRPGKVVTLTVQRGAERIETRFRLRRLI